jgi:hypothetical protein
VTVADIVNGEPTPLGWMDSLGQLYRCNKARARAAAHSAQRVAPAPFSLQRAASGPSCAGRLPLLLTRTRRRHHHRTHNCAQLLGTGSHAVSSVLSMAKKYPRVLLLHEDQLLCCKLDEMEYCSYKWNKKARVAAAGASCRVLFVSEGS